MMTYLKHGRNQAPSGILVVDSNRRIVSLNRRLIDMWQIPKHLIGLQDDEPALDFVSRHFEHPKTFINEVRELYARPEIEIHDTINFKNGQTFERHSMPQWLEGKNVGRIWIFREIAKIELIQKFPRNENQIVVFDRSVIFPKLCKHK